MKWRGVLYAVTVLAVLTGCGVPYGVFNPPGHDLILYSQTSYFATHPGNTIQLIAVKAYPDGRRVTANPHDYKWSSSNPAVGTINADGLFTALTVGQTEIACIEKGDDRVQAYQIMTVDWGAP